MKENTESNVSNAVGHRDHRLRKVQSKLEGLVPRTLHLMTRRGWLEGTRVEQAIESGQDVHPDDVTLTGLQLTIEAINDLLSSGMKILFLGKLLLGSVLDLADGALARHQGQASPEGAIKDVFADRIVENYLAELIVENIDRYSDEESNLTSKLITAFQLSTLTKATCEMFGVQTSEGGQGGMIQRRMRLFSLIRKVVRLKKDSSEVGLLEDEVGLLENETGLLAEIKADIENLIKESFKAAKRRAGLLAVASSTSGANYDAKLRDSDSGAAVEARKYVAIIFMIQDQFGVDMLSALDDLNEEFSFPNPEELQKNYDYINNSVGQVQEFAEEAMLLIEEKQ